MIDATEINRLSNYLTKDHNYRMAADPIEPRALNPDNAYSLYSNNNVEQPFAQNGWRNFAPFFGYTNIANALWASDTAYNAGFYTAPDKWAYGCADGGWSFSGIVSRVGYVPSLHSPHVTARLRG